MISFSFVKVDWCFMVENHINKRELQRKKEREKREKRLEKIKEGVFIYCVRFLSPLLFVLLIFRATRDDRLS